MDFQSVEFIVAHHKDRHLKVYTTFSTMPFDGAFKIEGHALVSDDRFYYIAIEHIVAIQTKT